MIRFSALLVALAIGLLVAGVAASSLPLVYVSIAVCAVAALLLAAGVLRHWSELFGPRTKRVASPFAVGGAVSGPASAGRGSADWAANRPAVPGHAAAQAGQAGAPGLAGFRAGAGAGPAARGPEPTVAAGRYRAAAEPDGRAGRVSADPAARVASAEPGQDEADGAARRSGRKGRPARRPAEPEPEPAPAEPSHAAATDDLWDRVNEELESAGKRDSGRLSWPPGDFSIPSGMSLPAEPPEQEAFAGPGRPGSGDVWQPAAGWQPPSAPPSNWPFAPPAEPASTGPAGRDTDRATDTSAGPEAADSDTGAASPAGRAPAGAGPADQDAGPRWTIWAQAAPGPETTVVSTPPAVTPAEGPEAAGEPGAAETEAAESAAAVEATEVAEAAEAGGAAGAAGAVKVAEPGKPAEPELAEPGPMAEPAGPAAEPGPVPQPGPVPEPGPDAEPAGPAAEPGPVPQPGPVPEPGPEAEPAGPAEARSAREPDDAGPPAAEAKQTEPGAPDSAVTQARTTQVGSRPEADAEAAEGGADTAAPGKPAKPAGPVQVTVVPGVARYHRSECILIRFLGEGDLEIMPKQEAVANGLVACRACQPDQLPDS